VTFYKKEVWPKYGFCCSKVWIVGLFSYIYINKQIHTFRGAVAKMGILTIYRGLGIFKRKFEMY